MKATGIEMTNSGISLTGDWEDICSFAKDFENVIRDTEASNRTLSRYSNWRPRRDDSQEDIKQKTVDEAKLDIKDLERSGFSKKVDDMCDREDIGNLIAVTSKAVKGLYLGSARYFSKIEELIYRNIMLKYNPYYFDGIEFSANLRLNNKKDCRLKVNFTDESMHDRVKQIVND